MNKKPKIGIMGNGKFTLKLVIGLVRTGHHPSNIIVISAREKSDVAMFAYLDVRTSNDPQDLSGVEYLLLTIVPVGSGTILESIKRVTFERSPTVISFVSGLNLGMIVSSLGPAFDPKRIFCATGNTNVASLNGIICISSAAKGNVGIEALLSKLGKLHFERGGAVAKSIFTVGSANAFGAVAIELSAVTGQNGDMRQWITRLQGILADWQWVSPVEYRGYEAILAYLRTSAEIFEKKLGYDKRPARYRALETLQSTVNVLLDFEGPVTKESIQSLIMTVATKGGSTEKSLGNMTSIEVIISFKHLWLAWQPAWTRTKQFRKDARESVARFATAVTES